MLAKTITLLGFAFTLVGSFVVAAMVVAGLLFWADLIWTGTESTELPVAFGAVAPPAILAVIAAVGVLVYLGLSGSTPTSMRKQ
jgi:hypothetical protein